MELRLLLLLLLLERSPNKWLLLILTRPRILHRARILVHHHSGHRRARLQPAPFFSSSSLSPPIRSGLVTCIGSPCMPLLLPVLPEMDGSA